MFFSQKKITSGNIDFLSILTPKSGIFHRNLDIKFDISDMVVIISTSSHLFTCGHI